MSLTRLAEVGEQGVAYVYEEAEDVFQDLTERLGLSIEEISLLDPSLSHQIRKHLKNQPFRTVF